MFQKSISRHHLITPSQSEEWQQEVLASQKNRLAMLALSTHVPSAILKKPSTMIADTKATFNVKIPLEGSPVTNQRRSGRCWLFASTNVFRVAYMKMYNLADFELSQAYLFFWDKLEKANFFLESMLDTHHLPLHGRLLTSLMASPVGDGGQWDMVANLVEKYGLVRFLPYFSISSRLDMSVMISHANRGNRCRKSYIQTLRMLAIPQIWIGCVCSPLIVEM